MIVGDPGCMPSTHYPSIVEAAPLWYREVAAELGTDDPLYAGRALHVLRDHLSVEASHAVSAVASVLRRHVSPGELDDVLANLSPKVRPPLAPLRDAP